MFDYLNSRGWDDNDFKVLLFSKSAGNSSPPVTARQRIKKCAAGEVDLNLWLAPRFIWEQPCLIRIYYFSMSWWFAQSDLKPRNKINLMRMCLCKPSLSFMLHEV